MLREVPTAELSNVRKTDSAEAAPSTAIGPVYMPLRRTHLIDLGL